MSLLINESYANTSAPLWLSSSGGTIDGDLDITGTLTAQYVEARSGFSLLDNSNPQTQVMSIACATNNPGGDPIFQVNPNGAFRFGQVSQAAANTEIVPSAPGANLDVLNVGGVITTSGTVGSQGLRLKNEQYISFTDEPSVPVVEGLRIYSAETGTPGLTFSSIAVQPTASLYFNQIGQSANSYIKPAAFGGNDELSIGGYLSLGAQSCGTGTIPVGATNVVINSTAITATSKVFFSFYGSPSAGPGNGPSQGNLILNSGLIVPGTSFRVDHTDENGISVAVAGVDCTFHWMLVN